MELVAKAIAVLHQQATISIISDMSETIITIQWAKPENKANISTNVVLETTEVNNAHHALSDTNGQQ